MMRWLIIYNQILLFYLYLPDLTFIKQFKLLKIKKNVYQQRFKFSESVSVCVCNSEENIMFCE